MQFAAEMPIAVAVIGICAIRRIFVHRNRVGMYVEDGARGELVRAFVRDLLPPVPPLQLGRRLQTSPEAASIAVGGLDAIGTLSPSSRLFIYSCVRKDAVLS